MPRWICWILLLAASALLQGADCLTISSNYDPQAPADTGDATAGPAVPMNTVTVRFINESDHGLDVQFHVAAAISADTPLSAVAGTLFDPANQLTAGIGLAGQGVIAPQSRDQIYLDCAGAAALGTLGGLFLGDEGEQIGVGEQRLAIMGQNYQCGDIITLYYRGASGGYKTILQVE